MFYVQRSQPVHVPPLHLLPHSKYSTSPIRSAVSISLPPTQHPHPANRPLPPPLPITSREQCRPFSASINPPAAHQNVSFAADRASRTKPDDELATCPRGRPSGWRRPGMMTHGGAGQWERARLARGKPRAPRL